PRYFLNNADVGIGAHVAAGGRGIKCVGGKAAFAAAGAAAGADTPPRARPWRGAVGLDKGSPQQVDATTVVVALGPYTGGGMHIAPGARMEDGLFDVVTIGALTSRELLLNLLPRIYSGTHLSHPAARRAQAQLVRIETEGQPPVELD